MQFQLENIVPEKLKEIGLKSQFGFLIFLFSIVFLLRLLLPQSSHTLTKLITEIAVATAVFFLAKYLFRYIKLLKFTPISVIINTGIIIAVLYFLLFIYSSLFGDIFKNVLDEESGINFFPVLFTSFYFFIVIVCVLYVFSVLRELFFLRQLKDRTFYFNVMIIFIMLSSLSTLLPENYDYIRYALTVVAIILISINSMRISWMAFLSKKEKQSLLIFSVLLAIAFGLNLGHLVSDNALSLMIKNYSSAFHQFSWLVMLYGNIYFAILFFITLFHLPTAEAYDKKAEEVTSLQNLSKLITQVFDFKELTETITDITTKVCRADASWFTWEADGSIKPVAVNNISYLEANQLNEEIFSKENSVSLQKAANIPVAVRKGITGERSGFNNIAVAPLRTHNGIKGYLVAARKNEIRFDEEDLNAIDAFSDYASVAIENSRLLKESLEKERLEKELDVAREVQRKILPSKNPEYRNLEISSVFIPAFEVGGDYYDFFYLDENKLGFVIADVSGKGISASFVMAEIKGIFESLSKMIVSPKQVLINANKILERALDRKTFVSALYGIIDVSIGVVTFSRAGHTPLLLVRGNKLAEIKPLGIGLGLTFGNNFNIIEEQTISLENNDMLVLYTDGVTEAKNISLQDFGEEHFEKILLEEKNNSAQTATEKVLREISLFSKDTHQHDDITLIIFKWNKTNGEE